MIPTPTVIIPSMKKMRRQRSMLPMGLSLRMPLRVVGADRRVSGVIDSGAVGEAHLASRPPKAPARGAVTR